ncbi:MAG: hypothetical protein K9W44_14715 [Candidatus Lokiarchaeota archaeon]|nr:hypothetical protein [Candidatus Harpocratesius repetitus]
MKKSKSKKKERNVLFKNKLAVFLIAVFISNAFFEFQAVPYATALSTGLKPGDVIVYDYTDTSSYFDTNMSLVDFYEHISTQIVENILAVKNFEDKIEIDFKLQLPYENKEENHTWVLNSTLYLGSSPIPQENIGFNFSDSEFFNYLNRCLNINELVLAGISPEGNITWDYEVLTNGLGFQINANYTNYKYNYTKYYNFSVSLFYSSSGVLLRRIQEFSVKVPPDYYQDGAILWVWSKKTSINVTLSNFDGKDERPWDPNYTYPSDISENGNIPGYNLGIFIGIMFTASLFIIRKRKHKYYND